MRPVFAIASTALKRFFRDRSNYFFVLILPMLLVVAIGLQFGDAGAAGRMVLTGSGPLSDRLATALDDQRIAVERTNDPEGARRVVARGRSDAAVLVTADDEAGWADHKPVEVTIISGSQANGQATTATVRSVLDTLSEREAGVVSMRFGLTDGQPKTLDEIGKVYGVTRERIRQIESKTMSKLRHPSRSQVLRDYLD